MPFAHACGAASAPAQYSPTVHGVQAPALPGVVSLLPAAQASNATHCPEFGASEYVPEGHAAQAWSCVLLPAVVTYSPTAHVVQPSHTVAFTDALNRPDAHGAQVRSSVTLPTDDTNSPGWQSRCATQAVAGL